MSTHTDPKVMQTHDEYVYEVGNLVRALRQIADDIDHNNHLATFDDDGHMRHLDHATNVVGSVNRSVADLRLLDLISVGARADEAIRQARQHAKFGHTCDTSDPNCGYNPCVAYR